MPWSGIQPTAAAGKVPVAATARVAARLLMVGDATDHGVGRRETRRDLVVAGLAEHDPGDGRQLAADPANGPEGKTAVGGVV
jgi:hypothetical protein